MRLNKIVKKSLETPVVGLISDLNYTVVHFADGSKTISGYTKKVVRKCVLRSKDLTEVRRGVEVAKSKANVIDQKISAFGKSFDISRRKMSNWIVSIIAALVSFSSFAQNIAPVAVNDTITVCNDETATFRVVNNDYDPNGDRVLLHSFTRPGTGDLVARGNQGNFNYIFGGSDTTSFSYKLIDVRFAGIGRLQSNTGFVKLKGAAAYEYAGTYLTSNNRLTCKSRNVAAVTITGSVREVNESFTSITLDAAEGAVLLAPSAGGVVELRIKK